MSVDYKICYKTWLRSTINHHTRLKISFLKHGKIYAAFT